MDIGTVAKVFLAGAAIAAPVGPVALLCIHRGISSGRAAAFLSGLGAATAHGTYALAAAMGLSFVSGTVSPHHRLSRAAAGIFLCLLGARILFSRPVDRPPEPTGQGLAGAYASALLLALSSPVTMLTIAAVFSGAGLPGPGGGTGTALLLASGVFLGSASWWLLLSLGVGWVSSRGGVASLRIANRITGAVLLGFGVYILLKLVASS
jgi:threonine/homoserine/homoserine lactone efflux protein